MKKVLGLLPLLLVTTNLFADDGASSGITDTGLKAIAAAIAISVAALGGALGQGRAAGSAFDGIARNPAAEPKVFKSFIIGMALIESLVILSFVVALMVNG
jgi:F-type H+-transporting ATPase subunit c